MKGNKFMEREYRKVIENIKLTKEEAKILYQAKEILMMAVTDILNSNCEYDKDLVETINKGIDGLNECNPRLNVNLIYKKDNN